MPKSKEQHLRYRLIDEMFRRNSHVTTRQLKTKIEEKLAEYVDQRTIQKDINDMRDDTRLGYFAPIKYDTRKKAYYYADRNYSITNFSLQSNEINALKFYGACLQLYSSSGLFKDFSSAIQKIIEGISLKQRLKQETNPDLIIQTDTIFTTSGSDLLELIIQAIDEKSNISFTYQKFNSGKSNNEARSMSPYLLKEFKHRWYVLGKASKERKVKTFALDRMTNLSLAGGVFEWDENFDPAIYFKHCFGITSPDEKPKVITLQFASSQGPYLKSLPIHSTQKILKEDKQYLTLSIEVIPSYELYEYILGKMPDVKVIAPKSVVKKVREMLTTALEFNS